MENSIQIQGIRNMLSHSGCPEDLLESYLQFLQTGGQQVQIVRGEVFMMFEKEAQYRKRRNEEMKGTVTFCKMTEIMSGNTIQECLSGWSLSNAASTMGFLHGCWMCGGNVERLWRLL